MTIKNVRIDLEMKEIKSMAYFENGSESIGVPVVQIYLDNATITKKVKGLKEAIRMFNYYGFDYYT